MSVRRSAISPPVLYSATARVRPHARRRSPTCSSNKRGSGEELGEVMGLLAGIGWPVRRPVYALRAG